jgi:hypothetical protein
MAMDMVETAAAVEEVAAMAGSCHGEFEHEHHIKFKHSTAQHDGKCSENKDGPQARHVTVLAETKRATEVVQA